MGTLERRKYAACSDFRRSHHQFFSTSSYRSGLPLIFLSYTSPTRRYRKAAFRDVLWRLWSRISKGPLSRRKSILVYTTGALLAVVCSATIKLRISGLFPRLDVLR